MQTGLALYCSLLQKIPLLTMKKQHWCRLIGPLTAHFYQRHFYYNGTETDMSRCAAYPTRFLRSVYAFVQSNQILYCSHRRFGPLATHRMPSKDSGQTALCAGWSEFSWANTYFLTLKAPITTAADDILKYFFNFSKKTILDISCESSAKVSECTTCMSQNPYLLCTSTSFHKKLGRAVLSKTKLFLKANT